MSRKNFMLSWVEHEKKFYNLGASPQTGKLAYQCLAHHIKNFNILLTPPPPTPPPMPMFGVAQQLFLYIPTGDLKSGLPLIIHLKFPDFSLIFPWHFTDFHTIWQINKSIANDCVIPRHCKHFHSPSFSIRFIFSAGQLNLIGHGTKCMSWQDTSYLWSVIISFW